MRGALLGLLCCAGAALAQTSDAILKPGQVWQVQGTSAQGQAQSFTVRLGQAPSSVQGGMVIYKNFDLDRAGHIVLTRLWHDPLDQDPEFLLATFADSDGHELDCFTWDPAKQPDPTRFMGVFATSEAQLDAYTGGNTSGLGTCTMSLQR